MSTVLNTIANLPFLFGTRSIGACRPERERITLDDPLFCVTHTMSTNGVAKPSEQDLAIRRWSRAAVHYFNNLMTVLDFVLQDCQEYREATNKVMPERQRLSLDIERLLIDTRSFLDGLLHLAVAISPASRKMPKCQGSYGKFAEHYATADKAVRLALPRPFQMLCEAIPWALDIRKLRDGYIHHGHESLVFYGAKEYCIDLHFQRRLASRFPPRELPNVFYEPENPNNLIVVDTVLVYLIGPAIAIRSVLGSCLLAELKAMRPYWHFHDGLGMPYQEGEFLFRIREWLVRNRDILEPSMYERSYFAVGKRETNAV
jgi:hypothetical protein